MKVNTLKKHILSLSDDEKNKLLEFIKASFRFLNPNSLMIESCPRCCCTSFKKNGKDKEVQRFICLGCRRSFNYKTNTIFAHLQKLYKWNDFVEDFLSLNISPLRTLKAKLHLSEQTIFNWRHKILSSIAAGSDTKFTNESVEFDEALFKISRKGRQHLNIKNQKTYRAWRKGLRGDSKYNVKVFFSFGRGSRKLDVYESHMGRTSKQHLMNYFYLEHVKEVIIISDAHPYYTITC